jgi:hypothetical protein
MVWIAGEAKWIEAKRVYLRQLEQSQIRIGCSEVHRVELDEVVADETSGTIDKLIETLQCGLEVATGERKRLAILKSHCGKLMDTAIIAAYL